MNVKAALRLLYCEHKKRHKFQLPAPHIITDGGEPVDKAEMHGTLLRREKDYEMHVCSNCRLVVEVRETDLS